MSYRFEQTDIGTDIVIDGFESGIADTPFATSLQTAVGPIQRSGIADMRNMNIISVPGEASVNFKSQSIAQVPISGSAFTAATSGIFSYTGTEVKKGTKLTLNTLTGGTVSVPGITLTGNTSNITFQTISTTTPSRTACETNSLAGTSAVIKMGLQSQPNNGDQYIIYVYNATGVQTQVVITFVTSIGAIAGNVLIGGSVNSTLINLTGLLTSPSVTNAFQVALSSGGQTVIGYFTVAGAGIAFDTVSSASTGAATSLTFNSGTTGSGANMVGIVHAICLNVVTSVTWGGSAMTNVLSANGPNGEKGTTWMIANPGVGIKSVVLTWSGATGAAAFAVTYSGADQSLTIDASVFQTADAGVGDINQTLTTIADKTWAAQIVAAIVSYTASTGITNRGTGRTDPSSNIAMEYGDSAGNLTAGAHSLNRTRDGGGTGAASSRAFSFAPATASNVTIGLSTSDNYWVATATTTTFTLTAQRPSADGTISGPTINVYATASGTFSTAVNLALLTQIAPNETNTAYYGIDTNGRVWVYNLSIATNWIYIGNTVTAASTPDFNTGIAIWNGYLIILYDGPSGYYLYTCPETAFSPVFTAFKGLGNSAYPHRAFIDKNYTLYWADGNQIGSLIELTTFDPTNSATYTYSAAAGSSALIQANDIVQCFEQLGSNLLIGGIYNVIYVWDRSSTGANFLLLPENNCHRMVTVNSNTYLFLGNRGRIYLTNGANAQLYKKIPDHLSNTIEPIYVWGGAMYNKNQLYFSLSAFTNSVSGETGIAQYGGIWAIDTNTDALRLVNKLSYDTYGGYTAEMCGMIANSTSTSGVPVQNFGLICGWEDSTETASPNYGSDVLPVNASPAVPNVPYSNYESYIDSDMIPVGTYLNPKTDANIEWKLTVPLVTGEGIKLQYRQDLSQSFTDITGSEVTTVGAFSGVVKVNFQKSQWLQIRVLTKSTASTPSYTRIREMRIR